VSPVTQLRDESSDHASVYERLKALTVNYRFRPHEQLLIGELAEQLHVSPTPVREALIRLQGEALLDVTPRRGFFAKTLNLKEMIDLVRFQFVILSSSVEHAVYTLDGAVEEICSLVPTADGESDISSMIDAVSERSLDQLEDDVRWVEQVSARIAALSENDVMMSALDNVNDRTHYVRMIDLSDPERSGEVRRSFEAFSFALQRKETPAALAILKRELDVQIDRMPTLVREGINRAYTSLC